VRNCFLIFCCILFILLIGPFLFFFNLSRTVASADYIKKSISGAELYQKIVSVDSKELANFFSGGDPNAEKPPAEFIDLIKKAIGQEDIKLAFEKNFDGAVKALKEGKSEYSIDISNLKTKLVKDADSAELSQYFGEIKEQFPVHLPSFLVSLARAIKYSAVIIVIMGLLLLIFLAVAIILAKGPRSKMRTASLLFLIGAIMAGIPAILGYIIRVPLPQFNSPSSIYQAISDVLNNLKNGVAKLYLFETIGLGSLALLLFVIGFFVPRAKPNPPQAATSAQTPK